VRATNHLLKDQEAWAAGIQSNFSFDANVLAQALKNIWLRTEMGGDYTGQVNELASHMLDLGTIKNAPAENNIFDTTFIEATKEQAS
jgi:hypothetical protein